MSPLQEIVKKKKSWGILFTVAESRQMLTWGCGFRKLDYKWAQGNFWSDGNIGFQSL